MRSKDLRYLGIGLGIGATIMGLFLGTVFFIPGFKNLIAPTQQLPLPGIIATESPNGISPALADTQTPLLTEVIESTATYTPTFTPTFLPTETTTPTYTPTLTSAELLAANGELSIVGPLTRTQQLNLYNASLTFIAPTYADSKKMSVEINGLRFSDPNTTCGPLSIAILQKAQIINTDNVPHDFFLINPDNGLDRQLLEKTFPNEHYVNTRYKIKLNQVDWQAQPLMPGDFLYIYAGEEGNFEHVLVVTRVDQAGRAYSVTNYDTEEGFIINEVMLYDPFDPSAGIFAQWTKRKDQLLGSTGFAGFEVWRFIGQDS
jgi:hypothetical protein